MVKTIKIQDDTHEELKKLGSIGETFDDAIRMLIREYHHNVYVRMTPQSKSESKSKLNEYTLWCSNCGSIPVKERDGMPVRACPKCGNKKTIGLTMTA